MTNRNWYLSFNFTNIDLLDFKSLHLSGGGESAHQTSDWESLADLPGKERQGKRENGAEKKEDQEREGRKLKMEGGKCYKMRRGFFFFFTFQNHRNLFWVY